MKKKDAEHVVLTALYLLDYCHTIEKTQKQEENGSVFDNETKLLLQQLRMACQAARTIANKQMKSVMPQHGI